MKIGKVLNLIVDFCIDRDKRSKCIRFNVFGIFDVFS